jgi:hypothetical protein
MSNQYQDTLSKLAKNFERYEEDLVYFTRSKTPPPDAIDDPDLDLPVPFRLAEIQTDKDALETFVGKNRHEFDIYAGSLKKNPVSGITAFTASRHGFAVRYGQRALGLPAEQLLPWPESLQRLFAQVQNPDLQQLFKEDRTLTPPTNDVPDKPSLHDQRVSSDSTQIGPTTVIQPAASRFSSNDPITTTPVDGLDLIDKTEIDTFRRATPSLRNRQNDKTAQQNRIDSEDTKADHTSPGPAAGKQSSQSTVLQRRSPDELFSRKTLTPIVGDKPYASFGDYINIVRSKNIKPLDGVDEGIGENSGQDEESVGSDELITEAIKFAEHCSTFFTGTKPASGSSELPVTEDEFSQWYYELGDYEQCYVQTAAALIGISAHEISQQADKLYRTLHNGAGKREFSKRVISRQEDQQETQITETSRFDDLYIQRIPSRELHSNTYTISRQGMGADRLYWQDVDLDGVSTFGINLLAFLTNEFIDRGEQGQNFFDALLNWSQDDEEMELSLKAAHASGVVLWCYDENRVRARANERAPVESRLNWRRTAELLHGAYEIGRIKRVEKSSVVLRLLDAWTDKVHQYLHNHQQFRMRENKTPFTEAQIQIDKDNLTLAVNLAWRVANTYELIGTIRPDIAFPGLQRLLQLPHIESTYYTRSIYAAVVSTYVNLARSGHVRDVLEHLAKTAKHLSNWCQMPHKAGERLKYRLQRQISLNAILEAFFLIAAESYLGRQEKPPVSYNLTQPLSPRPSLPDSDGRDVLLAGLLSQAERELKKHIMVLLCATIMEKKSRLAFSLLRKWADLVPEEPGKQKLHRIIVTLGKLVAIWCRNLEKQGFRSPPARDAYKNWFTRWNDEGPFQHTL